MNSEQIEIIKKIFTEAEEQGIPLWLDGGWAIDAQLGKVTREHDDIDIVFPEDKKVEYKKIIQQIGFQDFEENGYGFIAKKGGVLLDSETCQKSGEHYSMKGFPKNACPDIKTGELDSVRVRCISWDKMYFEFLYLNKELEREKWEPKHHASLEIIEEHLPLESRKEVENLFNKLNH